MTLVKSWIEISGARLVDNLRAVQAAVGDAVETLAVVKANGYGHDAALVARVLVEGGARWLGVSDLEEGVRVRRALGVEDATRVLVMCAMEAADAPALVEHQLTPVVWTVEHVDALEQAAATAGERIAVHLEIDTGMARQGAAPGAELERVAARLTASPWVRCEGVMSHLSSSEVADSSVTLAQRERFGLALGQVVGAELLPELVHLGNTSAVDEGSTMAWVRAEAEELRARAMVRTGLALYGMCLKIEGEEAQARLAPMLQPALAWKTRVVGLREIGVGDTVGYGATFTAKSLMWLALLPVGYADGLRREASSGLGDGWVVIAGGRAPVVGRVSMNLTVVDVTDLEGVAVGDEVVLLGEGVSAEDHAKWCGTIAYEILCGIRAKPVLI
jgi:alanine racemase